MTSLLPPIVSAVLVLAAPHLFDRPGDPKGCWCMFYRVRGREFERLWGAGARTAFREVVDQGPPPGLLAYRDGAPVGWCAVAPREDGLSDAEFLPLARIRELREQFETWSQICIDDVLRD